MIAVAAYIIAIAVAIPLMWRIVGWRHQPRPDPSFEPELGPRLLPVLVDRWHLVALAYTVAMMIAVELLLVPVLGFA